MTGVNQRYVHYRFCLLSKMRTVFIDFVEIFRTYFQIIEKHHVHY